MSEIVQEQGVVPSLSSLPPSTLGLVEVVPEPAPAKKRRRTRGKSVQTMAKEIERRVMARLEARLRPIVAELVERIVPAVRAELVAELEGGPVRLRRRRGEAKRSPVKKPRVRGA